MAEPIPFRLTTSHATRIIRERAAVTANVKLTHHARDRMEERGITLDDVLTILRRGHVDDTPKRNEQGDWQVLAERRMPGGRSAVSVTVIPRGDYLLIRTVMWRDER